MGAWGTGSFENDGALDWLLALLDSEEGESLAEALRDAIESEDYLEIDGGQYAIAAAETVAALHGAPSADLPDDLIAWVQAYKGQRDPQLATLALQALTRVQAEDSEIYELWEETEDFDEWQGILTDLKMRLTKVVQG